jgi:glucose-6-phosphate 1-dehydrogenase
VWSAAKTASVPQYPSGSWGPRESEELLGREGRQWFNS